MNDTQQADQLSSVRAMLSELEVDLGAARAALSEAVAELQHAQRKHDLVAALLRSLEG